MKLMKKKRRLTEEEVDREALGWLRNLAAAGIAQVEQLPGFRWIDAAGA